MAKSFRAKMEIVETCDALPCNAEVLKFLKENRAKIASKSNQSKSSQAKAATVVLEALTYLEKTPAGKLSEELDSAKLNDFFSAIEKFKLSPSEKLNILNHCPGSAVEIQLLIEDSEERLSEDQVEELLQEIKIHLNGDEDSKNDNDEDENDQMSSQEQDA